MRGAIAANLSAHGYRIVEAPDVAAAIRRWDAERPDVVLLDLGLPDGDGWELLQQANLPDDVYTIAMSGFGMNADRLRSKSVGYRHHMLKPFNPDELDSLLEEAAREMATQR